VRAVKLALYLSLFPLYRIGIPLAQSREAEGMGWQTSEGDRKQKQNLLLKQDEGLDDREIEPHSPTLCLFTENRITS
jgi:hypothetical protein